MKRTQTLIAALTVLVLAVASAVYVGAGQAAPQQRTQSASEKATALGQSQPEPNDSLPTEAEVFAEIDAQSANIPLPDGGTFNGINWAAGLSANEIARQLQANAACQWWRAVADGDKTAVSVAQTIPTWPAYRDASDYLRSDAQAATAELENPAKLRAAIPQCYVLHDLLVREARAQGVTPPQ